jgi:hypothetical protein
LQAGDDDLVVVVSGARHMEEEEAPRSSSEATNFGTTEQQRGHKFRHMEEEAPRSSSEAPNFSQQAAGGSKASNVSNGRSLVATRCEGSEISSKVSGKVIGTAGDSSSMHRIQGAAAMLRAGETLLFDTRTFHQVCRSVVKAAVKSAVKSAAVLRAGETLLFDTRTFHQVSQFFSLVLCYVT